MGNTDRSKDEEIMHRIKMFLGSTTYGMIKSQASFAEDFGYDSDMQYLDIWADDDIVDYADTFVLDLKNNNDWTLKTDKTKCNDVILSFISYSICVDDAMIVYFVKNKRNAIEHRDAASK